MSKEDFAGTPDKINFLLFAKVPKTLWIHVQGRLLQIGILHTRTINAVSAAYKFFSIVSCQTSTSNSDFWLFNFPENIFVPEVWSPPKITGLALFLHSLCKDEGSQTGARRVRGGVKMDAMFGPGTSQARQDMRIVTRASWVVWQ